jgi:alpha-beta hydrolase superfamily lysophospholipase
MIEFTHQFREPTITNRERPITKTANARVWLLRRWLLGALAVMGLLALLVFGATLTWLKWHESDLVFHTAESHAHTNGQVPAYAQRVSIHVSDGTDLAALIFAAESARDSGFWVLHLHGNADSVFSTTQIRHAQNLRDLGLNVLAVDYRGFGLSPGEASESHLDEDTETAYQELIQRGVPPQKIIVWGHSLGSGPAVYLAASHPVAALVLFGAFTSIPDAAQDIYPSLPVRHLTSVKFDSIDRIGAVHAPVIIAHSPADTIILFHHGKELFAAAHDPKRFIELSGPYSDQFGGHVNALYDHLELLVPALEALTGAHLFN